MRVFVAGATGALGTQLVPQLVAAGHDVTGMTRSPGKTGMLQARDRAGLAESVAPEVSHAGLLSRLHGRPRRVRSSP